jgi:hypothetical protein
VDRVFLDANVLFSVAYVEGSRLRELWHLPQVKLVTSQFAIEEARRNLVVYRPDAVPELTARTAELEITPEVPEAAGLPDDIELADKDRPILGAAVAAVCPHLVTGDRRHFGALYGRSIGGVLILTPAQYLRRKRTRR